jgi:hypothetical protein
MAKVYSVTHIHAHLLPSKPETLVVFVIGAAPTSGWTRIALSPWAYIVPPEDGIQDFDLEGMPPSEPSLNVITPVATAAAIPNPPRWLKGVRIHASSGHKEILLGDGVKIDFPEVNALWDGDLPWPDVFGNFLGNG